MDDRPGAAGAAAGPAADGATGRRPLRDLRPQRPLPPRDQPQQPAEAAAQPRRTGDHHPQREADAAGGGRLADRQWAARPRGQRLRQPQAEVTLGPVEGEAGPVPPEPARQARRLLRALGDRGRTEPAATPVRTAEADGAGAVQAVHHARAGARGAGAQHQERQAHRRARAARGVGRAGGGDQGPSGAAEPCAHAVASRHPGVRAGAHRGLGNPAASAGLLRLQRRLRRRPDGRARPALL